VVFDPAGGSRGKGSKTIYVAYSMANQPEIFRSTDAGKTWEPVPGQQSSLVPTHMVRAGDGVLYITYGSNGGPHPMRNGAVRKYDPKTGEWTDITPDRPNPEEDKLAFGYAAVSVDAHDPKSLIVSSFYRGAGEDIFLSRDGGKSWKSVIGKTAQWDF